MQTGAGFSQKYLKKQNARVRAAWEELWLLRSWDRPRQPADRGRLQEQLIRPKKNQFFFLLTLLLGSPTVSCYGGQLEESGFIKLCQIHQDRQAQSLSPTSSLLVLHLLPSLPSLPSVPSHAQHTANTGGWLCEHVPDIPTLGKQED